MTNFRARPRDMNEPGAVRKHLKIKRVGVMSKRTLEPT